MFDMKKHRVKKIKGVTESAIKSVGVVFEEVDRPLFPSIDGKNPSVYFQSLFFFGIWQNSNPLVDLDLYIPHVNLIDLKLENVGNLSTLLSSFKRAGTIIIEIATPSKSFTLPDCSFNTSSLSIDFGKIIPVNYLKWIGAHFEKLQELYIYSKYHEFEIATHLPLNKLERFHTSITQDYGFWAEFVAITPSLKTIYLPEHDYDRLDLIDEFPSIVFGHWQAHPGRKFNRSMDQD
ncbi:hypothetical protein DSO57_1020589 [Entomophthora muscae]|uniref:Uncharacterized protein n=1 Tax=Entomophthora muscae TaxID=34485 RepID=A0ACC2TEU4_9FUNG|nr:hypothetical protein DSO57_1020589 [Entomophthora muscae]